MPAKKEFTQVEIKDIIDLYCDKLQSMREIGRKYNCAHQTIKRVLNEQKCDIRNQRYEDLTNQVFGRLKVISLSDKRDKAGNIL